MIGALLAAGSTLASWYGSRKSSEANKNIDNDLPRRNSKLESWYNKEYNTPYLDTAEGKSAIQILRDNYNKRMKKVDQGNAIKGASDEMAVATADAGQQNFANNVTRLAGYGTQRQDQIGKEYRGMKYNLDSLGMQNLQNKSQNWSNFMSNAANTAIGASKADASGAFDKWDNKLSKWFKQTKPGVSSGYANLFPKASTSNLSFPSFEQTIPNVLR